MYYKKPRSWKNWARNLGAAVVTTALMVGGTAACDNPKNTTNTVGQPTETIDKANQEQIDSVISHFEEKGYEIEHFPHGSIQYITDDGKIMFTKPNINEIFLYDGDVITELGNAEYVYQLGGIKK